jgi:hypothetical protein
MVADGVPLLLSLINYAETLVRPAEDESALRAAVAAIETIGIQLIAPTAAIAPTRRDCARRTSASPTASPSRPRAHTTPPSRPSTAVCAGL